MMNNRTGVVLVYVDTNNNYYARYEGYAGRVAKLTNAWKSDKPLTQADVETLRAAPERITPNPEEPKAA